MTPRSWNGAPGGIKMTSRSGHACSRIVRDEGNLRLPREHYDRRLRDEPDPHDVLAPFPAEVPRTRWPGWMGVRLNSENPRFIRTPPRDDALALRSPLAIRLGRGLPPPSCRSCSAHNGKSP